MMDGGEVVSVQRKLPRRCRPRSTLNEYKNGGAVMAGRGGKFKE